MCGIYLHINLQEFINANSMHEAAECMNASIRAIKKFLDGGHMSMKTVRNLSEVLGLSVAELMLPIGDADKTEWYQEARIEYFSSNLKAYADELGLKPADIARRIGVEKTTINNYFKAKSFPMSDNLQLLAEALNVEVADLFLPPDGK